MEVKRIKFQIKKPNPLFEKLLTELYESAIAENNPRQRQYKKALQSLKKYPLVLKSGSECAILRGFGKKMCLILNNKLKNRNVSVSPHLRNSKNKTPVKPSIDLKTPNINNLTSLECLKSPVKNNTTPVKQQTVNLHPQILDKNKLVNKDIPEYKSESYAILISLLFKMSKDVSYIPQNVLGTEMENHCNEPVLNSRRNFNSSVWMSINDLLRKELIDWKMDDNQFSLTEEGVIFAKYVRSLYENKEGTPTKSLTVISPIKQSEILLIDRSPVKMKKKTTSISEFVSDTQLTKFYPGKFDILLLVDKQETSGASKKSDATICELNKFKMIQYELRHLKVGDFTWVARHKDTNEELVLPYIVERKRIDDLGGSIKDGRFHEQKFRLKQSGIENMIYLVEYHSDIRRTGLPISTLKQAAINTRIQDDFIVHYTSSLADSIKFLAMMTKNLEEKYKEKNLECDAKENVNDIGNVVRLMSFQDFNRMSSKTKTLTVSEMFIKQLLQLKGVSVEKALAIVNKYNTPMNLINAYMTADDPQSLLCMIKDDNNKRCNVGPIISKLIYKYYTSTNLS